MHLRDYCIVVDGVTLIGPLRFEYPKGHRMTCNEWADALGC
ncbi:hypothetical protein [Leifsonia sp. NPDC058248]